MDILYRNTATIYTVVTSVELIPKEFRSYLDVFDVEAATELLLYADYDYIIDLVDSKEPLYKLIYLLSNQELVVLREYLDYNLKKGRIYLS